MERDGCPELDSIRSEKHGQKQRGLRFKAGSQLLVSKFTSVMKLPMWIKRQPGLRQDIRVTGG